MPDQIIDVATPEGRMETFVACPDDERRSPAVIMYMDVWGVREELFAIARGVAAEGYAVAVPDLYYRDGCIRFEFRDARNRTLSEWRLDAAAREAVVAQSRTLSHERVIADTRSLITALDALDVVRRGPIGVVGYCMGGRLALVVAGACPDRVRATASLHGTMLISDRPGSPHLSARKMRGALYCGFAENDRFSPPPMIAQMSALFRDTDVAYTSLVHAGAEHGYALPERDVFDAGATERDWRNILAMFRRQLGA